MITFDGDRSKKRKWFANKQLTIIKDIDVPAKAVKWDGFTFKVWQHGDIDGGRITAPMGAVVACSTPERIKIAVADYWDGGFNGSQDLWVIFKDLGISGEFTTFFNGPIDSELALGYTTMLAIPAVGTSAFGLIDGDTGGPDTVMVDNYPCGPIIFPLTGERFGVVLSATMKYDLDGNGVFDWIRHVFEKNISFYIANGSQPSRMLCCARQIEYENLYDPLRIYQKVGADRYISCHSTWIYDFIGSVKTVGHEINVETTSASNITFESILNTDMPAALRSILINSPNDGSCEPLGSYATGTTFFHAVNASTYVWSGPPEDCEAKDYYDEHPEDNEWRLFYSMIVNGVVYLVNFDQFMGLLDTLSLHGTAGDWYKSKRMLEQLAGAWPNANWTVPHDSVMFQAHDGNLYTWTRAYGSVRFTTTGLSIVTLNVPDEVENEDGVRPEITYAGVFDAIHLYLCICNKVKDQVKAVYYGSPFSTWTKLPGVAEGLTLVHVRPVSVTPTDILLIGIVKETVDVDGVPTDYYCFASLHWFIDGEGIASTDLWRKMGRLPFVVGDADNLQVGLYGDDSRANALATYLSPPPILPQMPVGPYDKYSIGMP